MKAMILAAGYGKRMRPLTEHTPKPLLEVGGKPLIVYHLEALAAAGVREVVINTAWLGEKIEACLGDGSAWGLRIVWSREGQALETGGAILRARPLLASGGADHFLLISGDVWTDFPFARLRDAPLGDGDLARLVLVANPAHHPTGDYRLDEGGRVGERDGVQPSYTYSGVALLSVDLVGRQSQSDVFPLRDALLPAIRAGRVGGELHCGQWSDVGTVERLHALDSALQTPSA